jgi:shikimate kinase
MTSHILLVGMMGAGKTTTGKLVAHRLGWKYKDSDADVEAATGLTVPELFARDGEAAFRAAEAKVLTAACVDESPTVISVAGGAVLRDDNRRLIRSSGTVVWLRARPETLAARVGDGAGRPLLGDDPVEAMVRLFEERAPYYAEVADAVIDVEGLAAEVVADRVMAAAGFGTTEGMPGAAPTSPSAPTATPATPTAGAPPTSAPA